MVRRVLWLGVLGCVGLSPEGAAEFSIADDGSVLTVLDRGLPVLSVQYGALSGASPRAEVSSDVYIHPLYGMNGEVITGEPPSQWAGNPGLHWGWTECYLSDRQLDVWNEAGATRKFERWIRRDLYEDAVELIFQSAWVFADTGKAQAIETVILTVFGSEESERTIDLGIEIRNVSPETMLLIGSTPGSGLGIRLNDARSDVVLTGGRGIVRELETPQLSPYMDISYRDERRSTYSGVLILQHSGNRGYAKPSWSLDDGRTLVAGVNESEKIRLATGEAVRFSYRLLIHRGYGPSLNLSQVYSGYMREIAGTN